MPIVSARLLEACLKAFPGRLLAHLRHSQCQCQCQCQCQYLGLGLGLGLGLQGSCRAQARTITLEESTIWRPSLPNHPTAAVAGVTTYYEQ